MIARAESNGDLRFQQHLHPFVDVDQLRNDPLRVKHVQEISADANQVVPIGDAQNPLKPWFAEMKIGREEELHLGIWSRRNPGTAKKQRKEPRKGLDKIQFRK